MKRSVLLVAVAYTAALAVWTVSRLALGAAAPATGLVAAGASLTTQCIAAAVFTPWLACDAKAGLPAGCVALVTTPWPLLLLAVKISGISVFAILGSQVCVGGLIALSYYSVRGLLHVLRESQPRTIAVTVLQVAPATILWAGRDSWIPWFVG